MELLWRNLNGYRTNAAARVRLDEPKLRVNLYFRGTRTSRLPPMNVHMPAFMCVKGEEKKKSFLLWLVGASQIGSPSLWQPTSVVQDPHIPHPPTFLSCLQKIHTAEALLQKQRVGLRGSDRGELPPCPRPAACSPVAAVMSLRHLHSAARVSSGHAHNVLFMGTREVARRVAWSGRAFVQHCGLYPALK